MQDSDVKTVVRENVRRLLRLAPGESGVAKLMRRGFSNGTAQRLLGGETSFGVDLLAEVSAAFGLEPWQLCVPNLDPDRVPALHEPSSRWPFRSIDQDVVAGLVGLQAQTVEQGFLVALATAGVQPRKRQAAA